MKYRAPKGVRDILPKEAELWHYIEEQARGVLGLYGYREIRLPVFESTELFVRSIGSTSDIVEKEMYTFKDKGGRSLTLRPEGTASVVRAYIQNQLFNAPAPHKFFYICPMFRYERPQSGRYRQFHQIGVEAFGCKEPLIDAELFDMLYLFLIERLELKDLIFQINSIGCKKCRPIYRDALRRFISERLELFCQDCQRRYEKNPLRILDCKVSSCIEARSGAPIILNTLCEECASHFEKLKVYLQELGIDYEINPELVRGLDYYTKTTFEVVPVGGGSQASVAAGGRYDDLVSEFGGGNVPAVGFAIGIERLAGMLRDLPIGEDKITFFIASIGEGATLSSLLISKEMRRAGFETEISCDSKSLKSQMKKADKRGARYVIIIGDEELERKEVIIRDMVNKTQVHVAIDNIVDYCVSIAESALSTR